jgi:hypothetical protein
MRHSLIPHDFATAHARAWALWHAWARSRAALLHGHESWVFDKFR